MLNAYKFLIIASILFIIGSAVYFLNSSEGSDILVQALVENDPRNQGVSGINVYSGVYECTLDSGCLQTTSLILRDDTTSEIEGEFKPLGRGTWGVGKNGALVFLLDPKSLDLPSPRFSLVAKKVTTMNISDIGSKKNLYPGMTNPTFKRVSNE